MQIDGHSHRNEDVGGGVLIDAEEQLLVDWMLKMANLGTLSTWAN
jgi:hypothetical protein